MNRKKNTILPCTCFIALFLFSSTAVLGAGLELELSCTNPGTATPGYWMTHPDAWEVDEICIGGVLYTKAAAIELMWEPTKGDKTLTMFPALVAAKLNALADNYTGCLVEVCDEVLTVTCVIARADCWLSANPAPVRASSDAWQNCGEGLYLALDAYNNGKLCVPSRDALE